MEVIAYQIAIVVGVVVMTILFGNWGMLAAVLAAVVFTAIRVFTHWLMILQLLTVGIALLLAAAVGTSKNIKSIRSNAWGLLIVGIAVLAIKLYEKEPPTNRANSSRSQQSVEVKQSSLDPVQVQPAYQPGAMPEAVHRVIAQLEAEFPQLNERSPLFDSSLVQSALAKQTFYMNQGLSPESALDRGAREAVRPPISALRSQDIAYPPKQVASRHNKPASASDRATAEQTMNELRNGCVPPTCRERQPWEPR